MACSPSRRDQIADLAHGRLDEAAAGDLLEHIATCEPCSTEFDLVADLVSAAPELAATEAAGHETASAPKNRGLLLLAAALLLVTPLLIWQPFGPDRSATDFAELTPPTAPERLLRGDPGKRGPTFVTGMQAYGRGEFAAARDALRTVCAERPDDALANLYLGIAISQTDDVADAISPLRVAAENGTELVAERAWWFLANVHVRIEQIAAARTALTTLRDLDGDYAPNAEQLLEKLKGY